MNSSPTQPLTTATDPLSAIVVKHTNLVFSVAKRRLGNESLAEEVAQTVFIRLARSRVHFISDAQLVSWLHRTATNAAVDLWRSESRRKVREREAMMNVEPQRDENSAVLKSLDVAIEQLAAADREIILMRFFSRQRMREIAEAFGISEDAAKMRISRAVDKLRRRLERAGVCCSVAALMMLLATRTIEAAPAGLAERMRSSVEATSPSIVEPLRWMQVAHWAFIGLLALCIVVFVAVHSSESAKLKQPIVTHESARRPVTNRAPTQSAPRTADKATVTITTKITRADTKEPVPGALVVFESLADHASAATSADGIAALELVPNKPSLFWRFTGYVFANGFLPIYLNANGKGSTLGTNDLGLEITASLETGAAISGTVVDESGSPVPDVHIFVECPGVENLAFDREEASVHSDASGQFAFGAIPKWWSDVSLLLIKDGFAPTVATVSMKDAPHVANVTIERGKEVIGKVVGPDSAPIANAEVTLLWNGFRFVAYGIEPRRTLSASDGTFVFHQVNSLTFTKEVTFEARASGFTALRLNATCTNPTNAMEMKLDRGGSLKGRIFDEDGRPVIASIYAVGASVGRGQPGATSQADGRFIWNEAPLDSEFDVIPILPSKGYEKRVRLQADGSEHEIQINTRGE